MSNPSELERVCAGMTDLEKRMTDFIRRTVATYGKPGGPWNVPSEPGSWIEEARNLLRRAGDCEKPAQATLDKADDAVVAIVSYMAGCGDAYLQGAAPVLRQHWFDLVEANEKLANEIEDLRDDG